MEEMHIAREMWIARDSDNFLYLYIGTKPDKNDFIWNSLSADVIRLDSSLFPEVQWTDEEPTKVKLIIEK